MRFLSVCSGIEAASVAWDPLGWKAAAFAEIEAFPAAVLAHHYPNTPNLGDMTTIDHASLGPIDLLVGGTPCQSFSIAGLRGGMDDSRGNLALEFVRLALSTRPRWIIWENVPGVLSSNGGRDFGSLLGALGEIGYGFAHRVLDAQYFGVPQRRKRVFVVGYLGDWRCSAAALFERESLRGGPPPIRREGPTVNALTATGVGTCGADDNQAQAGHLIPVAVRMRGGCEGGGKGALLSEDRSLTLATANDQILFVEGPKGEYEARRLTARECERLQGFPDDYTRIPWGRKAAIDCPDGPRHKTLGNSMAVPVMRWLGERIDRVDQIVARL